MSSCTMIHHRYKVPRFFQNPRTRLRAQFFEDSSRSDIEFVKCLGGDIVHVEPKRILPGETLTVQKHVIQLNDVCPFEEALF